jgi:hypothetical protein
MKSAPHITQDPAGAIWRKSTYSGGHNECVEVTDNVPGILRVRDSKRPTGPVLGFSRAAWAAFVGLANAA